MQAPANDHNTVQEKVKNEWRDHGLRVVCAWGSRLRPVCPLVSGVIRTSHEFCSEYYGVPGMLMNEVSLTHV
jgi:hypothetical protein